MALLKTTYMVVTNDDLELPVFVGNSVEVSEFLGMKPSSLYCLVGRLKEGKRNGRYSKYKVERLNITEDDYELKERG